MKNLTNYRCEAHLSDDRLYRYLLRRSWKGNEDRGVLFVMLNPSTADETKDDATLRKCVGYAHRWGYSTVEIVNLFAWRSRDPKALADDWARSIGPNNNEWIETAAQANHQIIVAWGTNQTMGRDQTVLSLLRKYQDVYCLRTTAQGKPEHPLYLPSDLLPTLFARKRGES